MVNLSDADVATYGASEANDGAFLELRSVTRRYANGTVALSHVDLKLYRGESVAIIGRSGSGKSTLLNVLGLLDVPDTGELLIDGHHLEGDTDRRRSERRAADLGFVFQRAHLIPNLSTRENVLLGLRYANYPEAEAAQAAEGALRAVELGHKVEASARTLSGGEMQRVAIARTLARPAQLWLADEPTGNLDSNQSAEIIELLKLRAAERGACLVVVTHEPEIAARMDRVITLSDGQVVADTGRTGQATNGDNTLVLPTALARPDANPERRPASRRARMRRTAKFVSQGVAVNPRRAWSGIAAAALAVALTVAALGLAESAASQVTSLFDAQRASQVTARFVNQATTEPRWPLQVDGVAGFPGVEGVELWRTRERIPMSNGSLVDDAATVVEVAAAPGPTTNSHIAWASNDNQQLNDGEVLLGTALADRLAIAQKDVNPEIALAGARVRVVGIVTESRSGIAGGAAFVTTGTASALPASNTGEIHVETVPGAARMVADRLQDLTDPFKATDMIVDPVLTPDAYRGQLEDSVAASLQVLAVVAGLAGLVAVLFVNVLSVGARTAEFGVRRAFGARRGELVSLVVGESTILGLLGAVIGLAVGFLAVMVVTAVARWQPVFDPSLLLVPLIGAVTFGTLGGLPPAIAAGRIQPADAVRS